MYKFDVITIQMSYFHVFVKVLVLISLLRMVAELSPRWWLWRGWVAAGQPLTLSSDDAGDENDYYLQVPPAAFPK
jgi:hypothetical protein